MRNPDSVTPISDPDLPHTDRDSRNHPPMRICIDARSPGRGGIATYSVNLIDQLLQIAPENYYLLLIDKNQRSRARPGIDEIVIATNNPLRWFIWSNIRLPSLLRQHRIDIYHTLKHVTAFRVPARAVATLHGAEMIYRFPKIYTWYDLLYWRIVYPMAARSYDRLLTATNCESRLFSIRKDIDQKIFRTVPLAAATHFCKINDPTPLEAARLRFNLPERFILFVGRFHPIKNLERLIKAFAKAIPHIPDTIHLVLTGAIKGTHHKQLVKLVEKLHIQDRVKFTGEITDELPLLYNLAEIFVLVSLYENFGLVLLEAMATGTPVITSAIPDIDEVVGDAAVRVAPTDVNAISAALINVLNSKTLKEDLAARGLAQAHGFSWARCARETLDVYQTLVTATPPTADQQ